MLQKLQIRNCKCFDHFSFELGKRRASLIIGRNGSGRSTIGEILFSLSKIAAGNNTVFQHFGPANRFDWKLPESSFLAEFLIGEKVFEYAVTLSVAPDGRSVAVSRESLTVNHEPIFVKDSSGNVKLYPGGTVYFDPGDHFALPLINNPNPDSDVEVFKRFARNILVLKVWPLSMISETDVNLSGVDVSFSNFATWYYGCVSESPGVYGATVQAMQRFVPEFSAITFVQIAANSKRMMVRFAGGDFETTIPMAALSDGEKCLLAMSAVGAVNREVAPTLCFWDEPDNFLSKSEVAAAVTSLSSMFGRRGQLIVTTHDDEAILKFAREDTFVFERESRTAPVRNDVRTLRRVLDEDSLVNDLRTSLRMGDVDS